jgi:hypothetical protein
MEVFTRVKIRLVAYDIVWSCRCLPTFRKLDTVQGYAGWGVRGKDPAELGVLEVFNNLDHWI